MDRDTVVARWLLVLATACATVCSGGLRASEGCAASSGATIMPLVELYTSEGCSSCPPADRWLSRHFDDGQANFLAFHVDYWDSIGWPDRFASPAYSLRQRERVEAAGSRAVFTPQVMAGAQVQVDWRRDATYAAALRKPRKPSSAALSLRMTSGNDGGRVTLGAAARTAGAASAQVWLAEYVDDQRTEVKAGENRNVILQHDRVVRALHGPWTLGRSPLSKSIELAIAPGTGGVTAFVQDPRGDVLQSLDLRGSACL